MREQLSMQLSALQYKAQSIALDVAAWSFRDALAAKFSPDQPRDSNGRWANEGGGGVAPDGTPVELAATTNVRHAARMIGYDIVTFGDMIHAFKSFHGIPANGTLSWHEDGSTFYRGELVGSIHDFMP